MSYSITELTPPAISERIHPADNKRKKYDQEASGLAYVSLPEKENALETK